MDLSNPIFIQVAIDLALFIAIMILLWRLNSNIRKHPAEHSAEMTAELRSLITESQANADKFLHSLEQSRLALKEIALELDVKEKRVKELLEKSQQDSGSANRMPPVTGSPSSPNHTYSEVMNLINQGYSEEETACLTGCTQTEVGLIIDLSRIKNENV